MVDESIVTQARQWIDRVDAGRGLSNNWRLQVIQKRYRKRDVSTDTGTGLDCDTTSCDGMPLRIRRFVPGCPWALVDQAIRYLICKAPYTGLIYNGLEIPGTYRPTLTMWQRDEQSTVDEANPKNGTYTLIQDLIQEDCDDEETVVTGESCSYTETTEYHWDSDSPGELPGCGSECAGTGTCQGKTYAIQTRRNEDGSFDWQLVTRVTKTQHFGPYSIECNDCTRKTTREEWKGLYGNATEGYRDDCGNAVTIPSCDSTPGVHTQVQIEQAQDCTFNVSVTRSTAISWTDTWKDGTSCQTRTVVDSHNLKSLPTVPSPSVGETVRVSLKRNDDCTYDYQQETTTAPDPLKYGWTDGNACRPRTVSVYKDWRSRPSVPSVGKGETLDASITRNQDCTWDATFSVRKPATEEKIEWDQGSTCQPEHVISYQNSANLPAVPSAKTGQVVSASIRRNEDCTYDAQITVRDGMSAEHIEWTEGSQCKKVDAHHLINQTTYSVPVPSKGQSVSASVSRNSDCTYDVSYKIAQPYSGSDVTWTDGTWCKPRHHTLWIDKAEKPTITSGKNGQTVDASLQFDPSSCTWNGHQMVTDAYQGGNTFQWTDGSTCQQTTHTLYVDSTTMPKIPSAKTGGRVDANISFNDSNCTWSGRVSETAPMEPECLTWVEGSCCEQTTTEVCSRSVNPPEVPAPACGTRVSATISRNGDCTYDSRVSTTVAQERMDTYTWESTERTPGGSVATYENGTMVFKNYTELPRVASGHSNVRVEFHVNEFCLYDGHVSWSDLTGWSNPTNGGLRTGLIKMITPIPASGGRTVYEHRTYKTVAFLGSGNDGTEAEYIMSGYVPLGGHGSVRVYRNSSPETYNISNNAT